LHLSFLPPCVLKPRGDLMPAAAARCLFPWRVFSSVALQLLFTLGARAQSTATLQGAVTDSSGAGVPNANVVVRSQAGGIMRTTQTDTAGYYQVPFLPVGFYRVEVSAEGFQTLVVKALKLEVSQTVVQDFRLRIGSIAQEVTVRAGT